MKTVSAGTTSAWLSGGYVGGAKAVQRATVQKLSVAFQNYDLSTITGGTHTKATQWGVFSSLPWGQGSVPAELPNLKSIKWDRSVDQDVATCTLELFNVAPLPLGALPENTEDYDLPGFYSPQRGRAGNRWGHVSTGWGDLLRPDRVIRTYEGYGVDYLTAPERDPHMYPSGVWLIDDVNVTAFGVLTIACRDIGRVLLDQICLPPVVPYTQYPVSWSRFHNVNNPDIVDKSAGVGWFRPTYDTDSNVDYIGTGITDGGTVYVSPDGSVHGHGGVDAFDSSNPNDSYFMSVGNRASWSSAYEYVQGKFKAKTIAAVRIKCWGGPYTMYVSVYADGEWKGRSTVPYGSRVIDTHADIRFVKKVRIDKNEDLVVKLPKAYTSATKVRVTFSDLYNSGIGVNYKYRAGVRDFEVLANTVLTTTVDGGTHVEGEYGDYTDIVKWFLAWSGFYWFRSGLSFQTLSDGSIVAFPPTVTDPVFPDGQGQIWGDLEQTGTGNYIDPASHVQVPLTVDIFDKKPIMDCIQYVKEIVGFNFYIDEFGGAIFRSPNIWAVGNYVTPAAGPGVPAGNGTTTVPHTGVPIVIDENQTIVELGALLTSRSIRERVFVGNTTGGVAAIANGFNPLYPEVSGLRRIGGWTDQGFATDAEAQIMADLITVRQTFTYHTDNITIPGNPAIQVDDQIRIYERVTNESALHYVKSISSEWDASTGKWTYTLETFWLGETPMTDDWAFNATQLAAETKAMLTAMGKI